MMFTRVLAGAVLVVASAAAVSATDWLMGRHAKPQHGVADDGPADDLGRRPART